MGPRRRVRSRRRDLPFFALAAAVGFALAACAENEPRTLTGPLRADAGEDFTTVVGRPTELRGSSNVPSAQPVWLQTSGSVVVLDRPDRDPLSFRRTFVAPHFTGELAFSLTVFDGGRRATDEVVVTVVEQVFFVELGDGFTVQPGARVDLEASVIGATEPDRVQYAWSRVLGPEAPGIDGATGRTLSFSAPPEEGSLMVRVEASDPSGQDDSDTIVLEIRERNEPPVAVIAGDGHSLRQFESLALDGSGSFDPDGRSLAFAWRQTAGPEGATLPLVDVDSPIVRIDGPPVAGAYRVELEVTDRGGATGRAEAEVVVRPNPGPEIVVDFPTANANIGDTVRVFQMRGTVSDPDGVATLEIDGEAVRPSLGGAWTATLTWSSALAEGVPMRAVDGTGAARAFRYPLAATTPVITPVDLDVHPDGTRVVIADRGSQRVFEVGLETGIPTTLAARGDGRGPDVAVPMGAVWDATGDRVIVSAFDALYVLDIGAGTRRRVLDYADVFNVERPYLIEQLGSGRVVLGASRTFVEVDPSDGTVSKDVISFDEGRPRDLLARSTGELMLLRAGWLGTFDLTDAGGETLSSANRGGGPALEPSASGLFFDGASYFVVDDDRVLRVDASTGDRTSLGRGPRRARASSVDSAGFWSLGFDGFGVVRTEVATGDTRTVLIRGSGVGRGPSLDLGLEGPGGLVPELDGAGLVVLTEGSVVRVSTRDGERRDVAAAGGGPPLDRPLAIGREGQPRRTLILDRSRRLLTLDEATGDRTELAAFPTGFASRGRANVEDTADIEGCDGRVLILHRSAEALFALGPLAPGLPVVSSQSSEFFRGSGPRLVVPGAMACVPGEGRVLVATLESLISIDLDTGDRSVVSGTRGSGPLWRGARGLTVDLDGELAYVAEDDGLFEVDLTWGDRRRIADGRLADGPELTDVRGLVLDRQRELLFVQDGGLDAIVAVDLRTGRRVLSSR